MNALYLNDLVVVVEGAAEGMIGTVRNLGPNAVLVALHGRADTEAFRYVQLRKLRSRTRSTFPGKQPAEIEGQLSLEEAGYCVRHGRVNPVTESPITGILCCPHCGRDVTREPYPVEPQEPEGDAVESLPEDPKHGAGLDWRDPEPWWAP